ncbi:helix-turn-helix domain-containing protein [Microbacterium sp. cf332]|uniref:AraC family transcriptional regulator n=1 Tax=Microbacterium sp. cf332 TaxID=1761804 RepID=UPI00088077B5|nr:helix-turn-helix domain-containing protein [Microbacterium sp. cf332]SDQ95791.1 Helix-turn-helix domain-containing protein [Microbacterium sp. cf332]
MSYERYPSAPGVMPPSTRRSGEPFSGRSAQMLALETVVVKRYALAAGAERVMPAGGVPVVHSVLVSAGSVSIAPTVDARRRHRADAGRGLFLRSRSDHLLAWSDDAEIIVVSAPEDVVAAFGAPIDDSDGPLFAGDSALLGPAAAYFRSLLDGAARPGRVARYALSRLTEEMIGSLFLERASVGAGPVKVQPSLYRRALALIAARRADPELSVPTLATELAVSARHLQRAFAEQGTSPTEEIRRLRVELAVQLLGDARYDVLSIDEVSRYAGFGSADDLRRAFRLHGEPSPTRVRAQRRSARPERRGLHALPPLGATQVAPV